MYRPAAFDVADPADLHALVDELAVAQLVTFGDEGFDASTIPMVLDPAAGPNGSLLGHLARPNPQWRQRGIVPALAIFTGPSAYVSPSAYPSKREHGKVVPTWNYVVVHAHGELVVHDDPAVAERVVRLLTARHEEARPEPWSVDDAPRSYLDAMLRGIVAVELRITRLEGKRKLSQNRPAEDRAGVLAQLAEGPPADRAVAAAMAAAETATACAGGPAGG